MYFWLTVGDFRNKNNVFQCVVPANDRGELFNILEDREVYPLFLQEITEDEYKIIDEHTLFKYQVNRLREYVDEHEAEIKEIIKGA